MNAAFASEFTGFFQVSEAYERDLEAHSEKDVEREKEQRKLPRIKASMKISRKNKFDVFGSHASVKYDASKLF